MKAAAARLLAKKARENLSCDFSREWAGGIRYERFVYECETKICHEVHKGQMECVVETVDENAIKYAKRRLTANGYDVKSEKIYTTEHLTFEPWLRYIFVCHRLTIKW